jgi:hypothetical protein
MKSEMWNISMAINTIHKLGKNAYIIIKISRTRILVKKMLIQTILSFPLKKNKNKIAFSVSQRYHQKAESIYPHIKTQKLSKFERIQNNYSVS